MIIKIIRYLTRIKPISFFLVGYGVIVVFMMIFGLVSNGSAGVNPLFLKNKYYAFIAVVLIAPFIETIIFQAIPFYFINKFIKHKIKFWVFIFIAPILFIHTYNLSYLIATYFLGIILAFLYYIAYYRREKAIILITLIHFINNLIAYFIHYLS